MTRFLWICLGGAAGTGARYLLSNWALAALGSAFPWGTLLVNVLGSFLLGFLMQVGASSPSFSPTHRLALTTGVVGGFTTYSTFNYETIRFVQEGSWPLALVNATVMLVACFLAGFAGIAAGRWAFGV